jgi:hypothetical protein
MHTARLVILCGCIALVSACESFTEVLGPTHYGATLAGANVKPGAVVTSATGTVTASLHPTSRKLSYTVTWSGLTGAALGAHIHGPATANGVADVLVDFDALPTGGAGTITLTAAGSATGELDMALAVMPGVSGDSLVTLLNAGLLYVDVHTGANPTGALRGQLREN